MTFFPDLIKEKISWYQWTEKIKNVNQQIPPNGIPSSQDIDLILKYSSCPNLTRKKVFHKLLIYNNHVIDTILNLDDQVSSNLEGERSSTTLIKRIKSKKYEKIRFFKYK